MGESVIWGFGLGLAFLTAAAGAASEPAELMVKRTPDRS
jgi:hypothetical protein